MQPLLHGRQNHRLASGLFRCLAVLSGMWACRQGRLVSISIREHLSTSIFCSFFIPIMCNRASRACCIERSCSLFNLYFQCTKKIENQKQQQHNKTKQNLTSSTIFSVTHSPGSFFCAAAVAGVFTYTKGTVEEIRGGEDVTSSLVAGFVAGSLAGFPTKSILVGVGSGALMSAFAGAVYGIGSLQPEKQTSMQYIDRIKESNRAADKQ